VYFVSADHLGDLDVHADQLDIFDVVHLARQAAWGEPVPFADKLHAAGVTAAPDAIAVLMRPLLEEKAKHVVSNVEHDAAEVRFRFSDGSSMTIPRKWHGSISELTVTQGIASTLMTTRLSLQALEDPESRKPVPSDVVCTQVEDVSVNQVFYRREPHMMRRYMALAVDNIRRDPIGFVLASAYRAGRLFLIQGDQDRFTAQQFTQSRRVYAAATIVSIIYLTLFIIGAAIAWRRDHRVTLPLLLIAYLPLTLAPVLTNMRYSVTVQPLMFTFIAVAIIALARRQRTVSADEPSALG
jgi:hypothetical protein